jgi:hypothetical protein
MWGSLLQSGDRYEQISGLEAEWGWTSELDVGVRRRRRRRKRRRRDLDGQRAGPAAGAEEQSIAGQIPAWCVGGVSWSVA